MRSYKLQFLFIIFIFSLSKFAVAQDNTGGFKLFFEKVYLHTDRSFYVPGDNIWFKAYLVNGQTNQAISTSNNLYVELIDPANNITSRKVIRIDSGIGRGDFILDDSIMGGAYRIRAYTNWMRNFGDRFVFEKEIQVNHVAGVSKSNTALINKTLAATKKLTAANAFKIQFLPEAGSMVEGVPTVIAFKAEDANGNSINASGSIVSTMGDTVGKFTTSHLGMGSFPFKPEAGMQYAAWVRYGSTELLQSAFPTALTNGFVMNVTSEDTGKVAFSINSNLATKTIHLTGEVNITGRHAGKSYFKEKLILKDGKGAVTIPKKDFPAGIANITLYDESMHPHCERLVYIENSNPLNVMLSSDKSSYMSKEKVTVNVSVTDALQHPVKASLSISAVDVAMDKEATTDISSYLLLESELKGRVENASAYFDKNNAQRFQQLDLLMRTQGWRSFLWRQMADTSVKISYLPEPGITVSGKVTNIHSDKGLPNYNITLFAPGAKGDKIFLSKTNEAGKYFLDGLPLYGNQTITLNAGNGAGTKPGSISMDTIFNNILPVNPKPYYAFDTSTSLLRLTQEAARRRGMYNHGDSLHRLADVTVKGTPERTVRLADGTYKTFGYPQYDFEITAKDYSYKTLEWFLRQKVSGAMSPKDGEAGGVVFHIEGKEVRPRFIVDKKEDVFDRVDYFDLAMEQVISVTVKHLVGNPNGEQFEAENGRLELGRGIVDVYLIYLTLKPGAYNQQFSKISANVNGYYEARTFYAPNYDTQKTSNTDARNTIFWEPYINTDENGKVTLSFYNADPKTTIRIDLQGLTDKGIPVVSKTKYVVK